jgi:hypothetical protein
MPMTIHFAGSEPADFKINTGLYGDTDSADFRADYCRSACKSGDGTVSANTYLGIATGLSSLWLSARIRQGLSASATMQPFFRLRGALADLLQLAWTYTGSAFLPQLSVVNAGTASVVATGTKAYSSGTSWSSGVNGAVAKIDIAIDFTAAGSVLVYLDGDLALSYAGDLPTLCGAAAATISEVRLGSATTAGSYGSITLSEVILADEDTRALAVATLCPTGAGTYAEMDGTYAAIDDEALDGAAIASAAAGQTSTFAVRNLPGSSELVKAVVMHADVATAAGGPQSVAPALYTHATLKLGVFATPAVNTATHLVQVFATNPATTAAWTRDEVDALEIGIQSGS